MPRSLFDKPQAPLQRRNFLSLLMKAGAAGAITPLLPAYRILGQNTQPPSATTDTPVCRLDVCAPFVVEDPTAGIHSEIYLTSDTFMRQKRSSGGRIHNGLRDLSLRR